jgi:hypothetical protein
MQLRSVDVGQPPTLAIALDRIIVDNVMGQARAENVVRRTAAKHATTAGLIMRPASTKSAAGEGLWRRYRKSGCGSLQPT